ncbi:helix-turn-helix domain-containing protein [Natrialbaceae archaeon GCM10025810]|uniref:DUF7342 family protein n=1 Tax=Halovalidus salilacus TaxID=3075124 RepID=UPI00361D77AD
MSFDRLSGRATAAPDPDPERVIEVLDDDACREIVSVLEEPMSVKEISEEAEVPLSTAYKKLDRLTDVSLVSEAIQIRPGGHHRNRYVSQFERIAIEFDENRDFRVEIERPLAEPERQLVGIWSEVRRET